MKKIIFIFGLSLLFALRLTAGEAAVPYTFTNGTIADAVEVNANMDYFELKFSPTGGHTHDGSDSKIVSTITDVAHGGTGIAAYSSGDLLFATASTSLGRRTLGTLGSVLIADAWQKEPNWFAPGAVGKIFRASGSGYNPFWTGLDDTSLDGELGTINGGLGGDFSATAQGGVLYFSDTGTISALAAGTSGDYLQTKGTDDDPVWAPVATYFEPDSTCVLAFDNGSNGLELSRLGLAVTLTGLAEADETAGKVSPRCYDFDGSNDYASIANDAKHGGSAALTLESWSYPEATGITHTILCVDGIGAELRNETTDTNVAGTIKTSSGSEAWSVAHGLSGSGANQWVYIVVAWDNTGAAEIYVNGVDVGDGDNAGNGTVTDGADPIYIGADEGEGDKFNGKIDGVRILRRKMGAAEVLSRYNAFK